MKNAPILLSDLSKLLKKLPDVDNFPVDAVNIPFTDSLTKEKRSFTFSKRQFMNNGKEEKYWVLVCFVAEKGKPIEVEVKRGESNG